MRILSLLILLLNGCVLLPHPEPKFIYQDSESDSIPNAVIETKFCSIELIPKIVSLSIWRVSDDNKQELIYHTENLRELLCPVIELKPGVYFIAFDTYKYKRDHRGGYGKIVVETGQRYIFQHDARSIFWTVWLENEETREVMLGSKIPY